MEENIQLGLQLLLIGMISVFFILGIVVVLAKLLILLVNKFADQNSSQSRWKSQNTADTKHIVVLSSIVELVTQGKGSIHSINKI